MTPQSIAGTFENLLDGSGISLATQWKQIKVLTWANLKSRYRKTFAGFFWVILNPLLMYTVQVQVFSRFLKFPFSNYFLFLGSGLLPWLFMAQSMEMTTSIFISSSSLLKAFPSNPMVYLAAQLLDNFINFIASFLIILVPLCIYYKVPLGGIVFLPIPMVILCVGMTGLSWILATTQVFFRDTRYIVSFGVSIAYFLTPIFYPTEFLPAKIRWVVNFNPFYIFIEPFRECFYNFQIQHFLKDISIAAPAALFFFLAATFLWRKKRNEVYFYL